MSSFLFIPNDGKEGFHIGELLQISEEFQEEDADRVIGMTPFGGISRSGNRPDEREIDQGGNQASQTSSDLARGVVLNTSGHKAVMGKKPVRGFGKRALMFEVDGDTDLIEFTDHIA